MDWRANEEVLSFVSYYEDAWAWAWGTTIAIVGEKLLWSLPTALVSLMIGAGFAARQERVWRAGLIGGILGAFGGPAVVFLLLLTVDFVRYPPAHDADQLKLIAPLRPPVAPQYTPDEALVIGAALRLIHNAVSNDGNNAIKYIEGMLNGASSGYNAQAAITMLRSVNDSVTAIINRNTLYEDELEKVVSGRWPALSNMIWSLQRLGYGAGITIPTSLNESERFKLNGEIEHVTSMDRESVETCLGAYRAWVAESQERIKKLVVQLR